MGYSELVNEDQDHLPLELPGVAWEPLISEHAAPLSELLALIEESEGVPYRTSEAEIAEIFAKGGQWNGVAGFDVNGSQKMVAFGYVELARGSSEQVVCQGGVAPRARGNGIGSSLLKWQTKAGSKLAHEEFRQNGGRLTHTIHEGDTEFLSALEQMGYTWESSAVELRCVVERWRRAEAAPTYFEVVPWTPDLDDATRRAFNQAQSELGLENLRATQDDWRMINAGIRRDWSFVALSREGDRPRVIGFISVGGYEQDWEALGWREGVLQIAAAFGSKDRDKLLSELVNHTAEALVADGIDKISVTLDPEEDEASMRFYRDHGFEISSWFHTYSLRVAPES